MDDLLAEFLTETNESLSELDNQLVQLEQNPNDKDLLSNIFRLVHTIKGTCGFLGLPRLESVAHAGENVLGKYRDGALEVDAHGVSAILSCFDRIRELLQALEETGAEPEGDDTDVINVLNDIFEGNAPGTSAGGAEAAETDAPADAVAAETAEGGEDSSWEDLPQPKAGQMGDSDELQAIFDAAPGPGVGGEAADSTDAEAETAAAMPADQEDASVQENDGENDEEEEDVASPPAASTPAAPAVAKKDAPAAAGSGGGPVSQSIRVNVDVLEDLMNMVSELVLTRNQLMQILRNQRESEFGMPLQQLSHVTTELQEAVMKTRMQPVGNAWAKLPRIIRDLSMELGKKIDLQMIGQDTELDRQVLDLIKDPLTHMVRNSADHGIEMPAERAESGKPETGTVVLNAFHEGGHIIIEIKDDGKGLNLDKIKAKAIENGVNTQSDLDSMSDKQIMQLIFAAGFSTAEKVTSVSGRGVGMDVVRTNIEKIGGTIELDSTFGKGSTFTIKIPLTLAIVSALIIESGSERFAMPQLSVLELVRTSKESEHSIEMIRGTPVMRLRNRLLPLISLQELLNLEPAMPPAAAHTDSNSPTNAASNTASNVVPLESGRPPENETETEGHGGYKPASGFEVLSVEDEGVKRHREETSKQEVARKAAEDASQAQENQALSLQNKFVIVTKVGSSTYGIIVDDVFDTEEIVVKPVAPILKDISIFAGNTILGDGSVIMILDPNGIANAVGDINVSTDEKEGAEKAVEEDKRRKVPFLLFSVDDGAPKAVPLSLVARLEDIAASDIEYSDGRPVIQYRDTLMPLVAFDDRIQFPKEGRLSLIVFSEGDDQSMGLLIENVDDIVDDYMKQDLNSQHTNVLGSAVIAGKATEIINVSYYLDKAFGDWYKRKNITGGDSETKIRAPKKLLLIDDSQFFANLVTPMLTLSGYNVTMVQSAQKALDMCEQGEDFDLIISDIEMPDINGYEFVQRARETENWKDKPILALSSLSEEQDIKKGMEAGFTAYLSKTDRDKLVEQIEAFLTTGSVSSSKAASQDQVSEEQQENEQDKVAS